MWGLLLPDRAKAPIEYPTDGLCILNGNTLKAVTTPCYLRPISYAAILDCLSYHESRNNPYVVGKAGEKGILQFMPKTFQHFCVDKYGFKNDIWDTEIQFVCADKLINEGYIFFWTTYKRCLN